jgi:hypothetical protein
MKKPKNKGRKDKRQSKAAEATTPGGAAVKGASGSSFLVGISDL